VLAAVAFSVAVGFGIVAPAIPVFARDFDVGRAAVGLVLSAFALMRLASALGVGRLIDAIGERVVLATGIAIVAVSSALAGLAHSYLQLLVLRGAGGIGSAMFSVSAMGLLLRTVDAHHRARAVGLFRAVSCSVESPARPSADRSPHGRSARPSSSTPRRWRSPAASR